MEEMSKTILLGQLTAWPKTTHPPSSSDQVMSSFEFEMMAPSDLPLAPGNSFQAWRKPYLKSFIETGSNTARTAMAKTSFVQPSDANPNPHVLAIIHGNDKKDQDKSSSDEPVAVDDGNITQSKPPRNVDQHNMDPRKLKR